MAKIKKLVIVGLVVLVMSAFTVTALAANDYGSSAVSSDQTYTVDQTLIYAIQDENLAYAEYAKIIETFGAVRPISNIIRAEQYHIAALERLFTEYGIAVPANTATDYVTVPASLTDALNAGVQAEKNNIAMYEAFLMQTLPDDVKVVFTALKSASEQHLAAFERSLSGTAGYQYGGGRGMNGQNVLRNNTGIGSGAGYGAGTGSMGAGQGRNSVNGTCVLVDSTI